MTIAIVIVVLLAAVLAVLVFAATRPDAFRVQRSISIQAPPQKIVGFINDFNRWPVWSPFEKLDPAMKRTLSGAAAGQGAVYAWEGNGKAGAGRMEITSETPPSKVIIQLDFSRPFKANNTAEFTLEAQGDATNVTWAMYGASPFVIKLMSLFFSMDGAVGKDFEAGLANLKLAAEK